MNTAIAAVGLLAGFVVALLAPPGYEWGGGVLAIIAVIVAIIRANKDNPTF